MIHNYLLSHHIIMKYHHTCNRKIANKTVTAYQKKTKKLVKVHVFDRKIQIYIMVVK